MIIGNNTIIFVGKKRYYVEDLTTRDFSLECTTPYLLKFDDIEFQETKWIDLLSNLSSYLVSTSNKCLDELLSFRVIWSKKEIFSTVQRINHRKIRENLFLNCNHSADHSCWLIQDLLDFFKIDRSKVYFLIHRNPFAEPLDSKNYFKQKFKEEFSFFLKESYEKKDEDVEIIVSNIQRFLDPILANLSKSFDSFMLFDDAYTLSNYIKKVSDYISSSNKYTLKAKTVFSRYLKYISDFYKI